eukprot:GDKI01000249.1.p1 GENE.GDKI01000249.1~~GDKI01000249.1.p1  ORF type:complete len:203 (-),score=40.69 GDKI01000249.1:266-874(-)
MSRRFSAPPAAAFAPKHQQSAAMSVEESKGCQIAMVFYPTANKRLPTDNLYLPSERLGFTAEKHNYSSNTIEQSVKPHSDEFQQKLSEQFFEDRVSSPSTRSGSPADSQQHSRSRINLPRSSGQSVTKSNGSQRTVSHSTSKSAAAYILQQKQNAFRASRRQEMFGRDMDLNACLKNGVCDDTLDLEAGTHTYSDRHTHTHR